MIREELPCPRNLSDHPEEDKKQDEEKIGDQYRKIEVHAAQREEQDEDQLLGVAIEDPEYCVPFRVEIDGHDTHGHGGEQLVEIEERGDAGCIEADSSPIGFIGLYHMITGELAEISLVLFEEA
jgi:hypothetical protein